MKNENKERNPKAIIKSIKLIILLILLLFDKYIIHSKKDFISNENKSLIIKKGKKFIDKCLNQHIINLNIIEENPITISAVIPVYNCEKTIYSSICSIQRQNFTNYEIILIDDFSKDNSSIIIKHLKKFDKRIKIITNKKNMGSLYSRNIGVLISKGKFIFALDNDDLFFSENIFDSILKVSIDYNYDIVGFRAFSIGNYNDKKEKIKDLYNYKYYPDNIIIHQPQLSTWMIRIKNHFQPHDVTIWAKCIKKSIYKKAIVKLGIKRYSNFVSWAEDAIMNFVIFNEAKSFTFIHKYGIIHFLNNSTATFSMPEDIKLYGEIFFIDTIYEFSRNNVDKNMAIDGVYYIKRSFKKLKYFNNTNLIFFKSIINKFLKSKYISIDNKNRIKKDFKTFFV